MCRVRGGGYQGPSLGIGVCSRREQALAQGNAGYQAGGPVNDPPVGSGRPSAEGSGKARTQGLRTSRMPVWSLPLSGRNLSRAEVRSLAGPLP